MNAGLIIFIIVVIVIGIIIAVASDKSQEVIPEGHWGEYEHKYVYIISNPAWGDWYKVGIATNIHKRLGTYQTGSPFRDYKVEYAIHTPFYDSIEKHVHHAADKHMECKHEWVKVPLEEIIDVLDDMDMKKKELWESKMKNNQLCQ